jgi:hypothetical protein
LRKAGVRHKLAALRQVPALIPIFSIITGPARTGWERDRDRDRDRARIRRQKTTNAKTRCFPFRMVPKWTCSLSLWERAGVRAVRQWKLGAAKQLGDFKRLKIEPLAFDHRWPPSPPSPSRGRSKSLNPNLNPNPTPKPFCMRRGAQGQTDQGSCLSERSEFERDPGWTEHRRLPVAQRRDAASRVAFWCSHNFALRSERTPTT